jgi:hypothetical protein
MKTIKFFTVLSLSALLVGGCATVKVTTDTKPGAEFSAYQTFDVVHFAPEEAQQNQNFRMNQINRGRIEAAITRNVEARGMKSVEENPDVILLYASDVNIEQSYTSRTEYMGGPYWGYRGGYYMGGPSYTTTDVNKYYIGKLTIAIVEPEAKELLWYGQGTKDISGDANKAEETINMVVDKIMAEFPIGSVPQ